MLSDGVAQAQTPAFEDWAQALVHDILDRRHASLAREWKTCAFAQRECWRRILAGDFGKAAFWRKQAQVFAAQAAPQGAGSAADFLRTDREILDALMREASFRHAGSPQALRRTCGLIFDAVSLFEQGCAAA